MSAFTFFDLVAVLLYFLVPLCIAAFIVNIVLSIINIVKASRNSNYTRLKYCIIPSVFAVLAGLDYLANFEITRFVLAIYTVPFSHTIMFLVINMIAVFKIDKTTKILNRYTMISFATYLAYYLILPNFSEETASYTFLGMNLDGKGLDFVLILATLILVTSVVFLILQIVETVKVKKRKKQLI